MSVTILVGDVLDKLASLEDESVHCVVTSPPYWGLRDYGVEGQLGLEPTVEEYVEKMVAVFREVRRVLRKDGTLWLNHGSCYASAVSRDDVNGNGDKGPRDSASPGRAYRHSGDARRDSECSRTSRISRLLPVWRGLRGTIGRDSGPADSASRDVRSSALGAPTSRIHPASTANGPAGQPPADAVSACLSGGRLSSRGDRQSEYNSACTGGTVPLRRSSDHHRWGRASSVSAQSTSASNALTSLYSTIRLLRIKPKDLIAQPWWIALALQADGWWLRRDIIWHKPNPMPESCRDRPTTSHEYVFMFTKAARYFWDEVAVREDAITTGDDRAKRTDRTQIEARGGSDSRKRTGLPTGSHRNSRSVWTIPTQPFPEAHFATFPEELPRRCIAAGTSEKGCCPKCGAPWVRVVERKTRGESWHDHKDDGKIGQREESNEYKGANYYKNTTTPQTTGWRCSCDCVKQKQPLRIVHETTDAKSGGSVWTVSDTPAVPCTVLDPFSGAGTTGLVAVKMGRNYIGIELNAEYAQMSEDRIYKAAPLLIGD